MLLHILSAIVKWCCFLLCYDSTRMFHGQRRNIKQELRQIGQSQGRYRSMLRDITVCSKKSKRRFFKVGNGSGFQWIPNIFERLKVQILSTHSGDYKNFGPAVRNFYLTRRIFYQVRTLDFHFLKKNWVLKIPLCPPKSPGFHLIIAFRCYPTFETLKILSLCNFTNILSSETLET